MDSKIEKVVEKISATGTEIIRIAEISPSSVLLELKHSRFLVHLDERIDAIDIELEVKGEPNGPLQNITRDLVSDLLEIECDRDELIVKEIDSALGDGRISAAEIRAYFLGHSAGYGYAKQ